MRGKRPALVSSCRVVEILENRVLLDGSGLRAELFPTSDLSGTDDHINIHTGGESILGDDVPMIAFVETADVIWGVLDIEVGLLA